MEWVAHGVTLARMTAKRTARLYRGKVHQLVLTGGFYLVLLVGAAAAGYRASPLVLELLVEFDIDVSVALRSAFGFIWLFVCVIYIIRALGKIGDIAAPEAIFTTVPVRSVALGLLLSEGLFLSLWVVPPSLLFGIGAADALGQMSLAITVPVAVLLTAIFGLAVGLPIGVAIRYVASRVPFIVRHKMAIIGLVVVGYFALLLTDLIDRAIVALADPLARVPVAFGGDVAGAGWATAPTTWAAVGTFVALTVIASIGSLVALSLIGGRYWLSDPVIADDQVSVDRTRPAERPRLDRLGASLGATAGPLVVVIWRRAVRSPIKLLYAAYPVLVLGVFLADVIRGGTVPVFVPILVVFVLTWAAGVLFTLNPLGDQGRVLPATLLAQPDGRMFVMSHVLASALVTVPISILLVGGFGLIGEIDPIWLTGVLVATPVVIVAGTIVSIAVGMVFPKFDAVSVTRSMETVMPSMLAFGVYTAYLIATGVGALVAIHAPSRTVVASIATAVLPLDMPVGAILTTSLIVIVGGLLAPIVAYRYAIRTYETYVMN